MLRCCWARQSNQWLRQLRSLPRAKKEQEYLKEPVNVPIPQDNDLFFFSGSGIFWKSDGKKMIYFPEKDIYALFFCNVRGVQGLQKFPHPHSCKGKDPWGSQKQLQEKQPDLWALEIIRAKVAFRGWVSSSRDWVGPPATKQQQLGTEQVAARC